MKQTPTASIRILADNPDHHLWNNNGTFWCHYTVHHDDYTKQRVRVSLGTNDVQIARALRDFLMQATPKITSNIPKMRGQAMPDAAASPLLPTPRSTLPSYSVC
jgi:spore coat polysaccharide biosynthesis protein SpsF (cytidylyltransferase family)